MSESKKSDERLAVILSILPDGALFLHSGWTGNLWTGEIRSTANKHTVYTSNSLSAFVIDPLSVTREAMDEVARFEPGAHPFVPVGYKIEEIKDGTIVAAMADEIIRLRAIVAQSEKP